MKQRLLRNRPGSALRPLATSCTKDYKAHSLEQSSFAEWPNRDWRQQGDTSSKAKQLRWMAQQRLTTARRHIVKSKAASLNGPTETDDSKETHRQKQWQSKHPTNKREGKLQQIYWIDCARRKQNCTQGNPDQGSTTCPIITNAIKNYTCTVFHSILCSSLFVKINAGQLQKGKMTAGAAITTKSGKWMWPNRMVRCITS